MMKSFVCLVISLLGVLVVAPAQDLRFLNERHGYERGERILLRMEVAGADHVAVNVSGWLPEHVAVRGGGATYPIDSSVLRSGDYDVIVQPIANGRNRGDAAVFRMTIAPARDPQRFPVWNRAGGNSPDYGWWKARGFTSLEMPVLAEPLTSDSKLIPEYVHELEKGTRAGMEMGAYFNPLYYNPERRDQSGLAVLPDGKQDPKQFYPREPSVLERARRTAATWTARFAEYPSWRNVLLSSEYQTPFCINDSARKAAKEEAGLDLTELLRPQWIGPKDFTIRAEALPPEWQPKNGVIADDNPIYRFLKWWWERGHGTNLVNLEMARAVKAQRPDVLTWHEPYRLAAVYNSHTGLDFVSSWTYGHPDIKRLLYTTVLQAAARKEHQKVMQTITLWIYGRFVIPIGTPTADLMSDRPGTDPHFTQNADYVREAMWLVMSQRPDALFFYYSGPPDNPTLDPFLTSPEAIDAIGEISHTLVQPFGPMILESHRAPARVAVLMSATSVWFPGKKLLPAYPNEQILPFITLLARNHVPFDVLLDDDIATGALSKYDALIISRGDTLTRTVHQRVMDFARSGKKVIADDTLRASIPGCIQTGFNFDFENDIDGRALAAGHAMTAEQARTRMEEYATKLAPLLADVPRPADSDSQRVLVNTIQTGSIRYVFAVNDDRTYGGRFAQWKLEFETGVRQTAKLRVAVTGRPAIYDAISRKPVEYEVRNGMAEFPATLPPARGKLFAVLPEAVGGIDVKQAANCSRGETCPIAIRILGQSGKSFHGAMPIQIEITDPDGRKSEFNRFGSTAFASDAPQADATYMLPFRPAINDVPGEWQLRVTDLVAGKEQVQQFRVQ